MRKWLAVALFLIQLRPFIGAGICLHAEARSEQQCGMPKDDKVPASDQSQSASPPGCTLMALCAAAGPVVPQLGMQLSTLSAQSPAEFLSPQLMRSTESSAPPQPPPIA